MSLVATQLAVHGTDGFIFWCEQLARKQKNMFSSFFVKKSASPSPDAGPCEFFRDVACP